MVATSERAREIGHAWTDAWTDMTIHPTPTVHETETVFLLVAF
jgi:hypothetical protein